MNRYYYGLMLLLVAAGLVVADVLPATTQAAAGPTLESQIPGHVLAITRQLDGSAVLTTESGT